jgi:ribosomal protein S18 acetylase RimI-like enzyme
LAWTHVQGVRVDGERVEDGHADRRAALRRARAKVIRKLASSDGLVLKDVRLRALRQAPEAFAQSAAEVENDPDEAWVARAAELAADDGDSVVFLAFGHEAPAIGMAGAYLQPNEDDVVVWGVWVDPAARGAGWGRRLMERVIEWAENQHRSRLALWMTSTSEPALGLYRGLGFQEVGESRPHPRFPSIVETAMSLDLNKPPQGNRVKAALACASVREISPEELGR